MASQSKIMSQVTQSVDFMIDKVKDDINARNVESNINLTTDQMRKLFSLIDMSMRDAYNRTMDQIISSID
jgi:CRISPR/Cas system CSM-associated protein Csm2 small subunit|tara:strand:+ start:495 stop:704 length:210 start_codon:yes stop_codon:yes gene_type:complete